MGLQKYRADMIGDPAPNGAVPCYARWMGGPTLAVVRNCPIKYTCLPNRTVYTRGEPDTWFSIPAACQYRGRTIKGYITTDDDTGYYFVPLNGQNLPIGPKRDAIC
jgi:hypothetical protein